MLKKRIMKKLSVVFVAIIMVFATITPVMAESDSKIGIKDSHICEVECINEHLDINNENEMQEFIKHIVYERLKGKFDNKTFTKEHINVYIQNDIDVNIYNEYVRNIVFERLKETMNLEYFGINDIIVGIEVENCSHSFKAVSFFDDSRGSNASYCEYGVLIINVECSKCGLPDIWTQPYSTSHTWDVHPNGGAVCIRCGWRW